MEIKKIKAALAALVIMGLTFTACSGDDGEQGPAGAPGVNGTDGNANVSSDTYTLMSNEWSGGNATIDVPALTKDIAENGQVAVYFTFDSLGTDTITWNPLPWRVVLNLGGVNQFVTFQNNISIGQVVISARTNTNQGVNIGGETNARVILIPSNSNMEGVDINDYEQVKMVYGIQEYDM